MTSPCVAVFSDVHSNLEALEAVLSDMDSLGIENRVCLGDTVGYGPNPEACLKLVRELDCPVLLGNHDEMAAFDMELVGINEVALAGIEFSRKKLSAEEKAYLQSLPQMFSYEGCQFVHSSLIQPFDWYYITNSSEAFVHLSYQEAQICFIGHTHVPVVWEPMGEKWAGRRMGLGKIDLPRRNKCVCNVGSVGQPRDLDSRACYVVYRPQERTVEFRRVDYDIAKTKRKISRARLPGFLGQRLSLGR